MDGSLSMKVEPFLSPGLAWALVVLFSVLWVALGVAWGRRGKGDADEYMLAGRNIGLALSCLLYTSPSPRD